jgi:hypothetical protein
VIALALVPVLVTLAARWTAPVIARRCAPRWAARCLVAVSLSAAFGTGLAMCAVACLGLCQMSYLSRAGGWSADTLSDHIRVPWPAAVAMSSLALVLVVAAVVHVVRTARSFANAARSCRALDPHGAGLVVVDDDRVRACAVPGRPGRILVSRSLLGTLSPAERQAVLAHESAHLRYGHFGYVQAAELAAAANPLLTPVASAVRLAVESWADEAAVEAVGDRTCVARALARASLPCGPTTSPAFGIVGAALPMAAETDLAARIGNLLAPRQHRARVPLAIATTLSAAVSLLASGAVGTWAHGLFELAQRHH